MCFAGLAFVQYSFYKGSTSVILINKSYAYHWTLANSPPHPPKACAPDNSKGAFGFWGQNGPLAFYSTIANDGATCCS